MRVGLFLAVELKSDSGVHLRTSGRNYKKTALSFAPHPNRNAPQLRDAWPVICVLGITQIIGYGSVFYSFSLLMEPLQGALGSSKSAIVGAFSFALVVAGLCATHVGSTIDRIGGRQIMTIGSVAAGLLLVALSHVESLFGLYVVYACLGATMAAILYEPAFAVLTGIFGANARRAITMLTLFGGLSSTLFWPLTQHLMAQFGWRDTLLILGALNLVLCAPLHLRYLPRRHPARESGRATGGRNGDSKSLREVLREPTFYFLGGAFVANGLIFSAMSVHMLAMMQSKGLTVATAALLGALVGPMQVTGRIFELTAGRRFSIVAVGLVAMALLPVALLVFANAGGHAAPLVAFALLYGLSNGVVTIVRGAMPAQLFGRDHYGAVSGALAAPQMFALASGPVLVSLVWRASGGNYDRVLLVLSAVAAVGVASFYAAIRTHRKLA
ncbi:MAG: MFS transporter [Betaproteobacteria bacterium]